MLKQKLFPLISAVFLIASCSNESSTIIKLNRPVPGNIGLTSGLFTAKKGKRLTFTFDYSTINTEFISVYKSGNFFNFNDGGTGNILINFANEDAGIGITYYTPNGEITLQKSDKSIIAWSEELGKNPDNINNTYVYGKIFQDWGDYYVLLFCHVNKSAEDSVKIELTSNNYHKNIIAHFLAGVPL